MSKDLFGIPYMGSKTKMARTIHRILPDGKRFVDLFGGGFAMSHSALLLPDKYETVLYNDYNPLTVELIRRAYNGEFNYKVFRPEFVTREMFEAGKDKDGYIKYIWSFGNSGKAYLYGRDIEPMKHAAHDLVVFGKRNMMLEEIAEGINNAVTGKDIYTRRRQFCNYVRGNSKRADFEPLERLELLQRVSKINRFDLQHIEQLERLQHIERFERLQHIERFERLQHIERLEITCNSYTEYKYRDGDIVYCDPPYEGTADYGEQFDHKAFYDWVASRPFQLWFSSYNITDDRFRMIYAKRIASSISGTSNSIMNYERIYTNK